MIKVLSPQQMAEADKAAIEAGTPVVQLMERAGGAVARAALELAGGAYGKRIVIVCGKGNNGGDGYVTARRLAAAGAFPVVVPLAEPEPLGSIRSVGIDKLERELSRADVAVDAMVGTGFHGKLEGSMATAAALLNDSGLPIVAVDIPSGVNGETGGIESAAVHATMTVTMGAPKTGLVLMPGAEYAGRIEVADIGVPLDQAEPELLWVTPEDVAAPLPERGYEADKRSVGTVMVIAGSVGMGGAAVLVARGALRAGAGLVSVAAPRSIATGLHQTLAEGTTIPLPETEAGSISPEAQPIVIERSAKFDCVALGPGLSTDPETFEFVRKAVLEIEVPMVIDADGINAFKGDPAALASRTAPTVLTPHARELARLLGTEETGLAAVREAARRTGAVVLLKGYRTLIADPAGTVWVVTSGGPVLATGGTGDVLTGVIAAFTAAMGGGGAAAAWAGAWVHGRAGELLEARMGDRGVVAGDVAGAIPEVLASIR